MNNSLVDSFARAGYLVVAPDYFEGEPAPADPGLQKQLNFTGWLSRHGDARVDPIIQNTITYMREKLGIKYIGATGYCFGGRYVARYLAKGKGVDAGFMAHPSLMKPAEIEAMVGPVSIGAAGMSIW
jgi:dienelactone hydrolase